MEITEVDPKLIDESKAIKTKALENINEAFDPGWSSDQHRAKAREHDLKADKLVSGDEKDSHITASRAHNRAADAIDAATKASAKCAALD
ncbi:hypothetical protein SBA1_100069 [Candidatus Sulfotelmatobacter kueseliae]|uniref:Uncharacterized protein n=1 Tax=Candidatus Sulfotelmatobacter kueseliae TaxID=2042962 RepID=A0A2U3JW16_9BACT|nr:hypothetical protein SBA1_100069 [Candidatus Sulfotelmatobacter kueseliae]